MALPPKRAVTPLTEEDKIDILHEHRDGTGNREIARKMGRSESTVRSFLKSYKKNRKLFPKRGRWVTNIELPKQVLDKLLEQMQNDRRFTLRAQSAQESLPVTKLWELRHNNGYHFYKEVTVSPLSDQAKQDRLAFCLREVTTPFDLPIIFTDESTVEQDLRKGGIWRRKGEIIPEMFVPTEAHPISVMVWGGIGPNGLRTDLIRCPASVTGESFIQFLADNRIIGSLNTVYGEKKYYFQQDNASPHRVYRDLLQQHMLLIDWPARSPDLSPIEQVWGYIKHKLKGRRFQNEDDLFAAIRAEWWAIPDTILDNYVSSFHFRCQTCAEIGGAPLAKHWKRVHELHHPVQ
jgi:transposase